MLAEVKSGVTFPVGGRVVTVPATGETAVVGFGIPRGANRYQGGGCCPASPGGPENSSVLAQDSLCGMLLGDKVTWEGKVSDRTAHIFETFQDPVKGDPLAVNGLDDIKRRDHRRELIVADTRLINTYRSVRRGQLPPGVVLKTWFNEDLSWAFGVAVYLPGVTKAVSEIAKEMDQTDLLAPSGAEWPGRSLGETSVESPLGNRLGRSGSPAPSPAIKRGPTGKLDSKDL